MDQIKIGTFIASLRKEKGMTQAELAKELGITDRAVSKWENGRGLPELSLIIPLCESLDITVNELLSGERIKQEELAVKTEENIINTLEYSSKNIKSIKKVFIIVLSAIISIVFLLSTFFGIDLNRMRRNLPVVFSTWGFKYTPPIDLSGEKIDFAIKTYITEHGDSEPKHHENEKTFAAIHTYLIEETVAKKEYRVYSWVLQEKYYYENEKIKKDSACSIPYHFIVERSDDEYTVIDSRSPRDGSYYSDDMKTLFPASVRNEMNHIYTDGSYEKLEFDIKEQLTLYFS